MTVDNQLGALVFGQAFLVAFLDIGLVYPAAQAGLADPRSLAIWVTCFRFPGHRTLSTECLELRCPWQRIEA